jgi:hypothetical protein
MREITRSERDRERNVYHPRERGLKIERGQDRAALRDEETAREYSYVKIPANARERVPLFGAIWCFSELRARISARY